jgi:hypothetical protein
MEQIRDLSAAEHDRQVERTLGAHDVVEPRKVGAENGAVEKQNRAQRLILS